jgi:hypothetical protein
MTTISQTLPDNGSATGSSKVTQQECINRLIGRITPRIELDSDSLPQVTLKRRRRLFRADVKRLVVVEWSRTNAAGIGLDATGTLWQFRGRRLGDRLDRDDLNLSELMLLHGRLVCLDMRT